MVASCERRNAGVLITDFDGTMTRHDFYQLAIKSLLPEDVPDYWQKYRSGEMTHFEALQSYFARIRATERELLDVVEQMELDPGLCEAVESLQSAGWRIVVTSAGCDWYIKHLLNSVGVEIDVYANPGRFEPDRGLIMRMPTDSPYLSEKLGVDKAGVVSDFLQQGLTVAFAGDGFPDADPARLVAAEFRFARGALADVLLSSGLTFHFFTTWSDIAHRLLEKDI